jgi:hypothetical protein
MMGWADTQNDVPDQQTYRGFLNHAVQCVMSTDRDTDREISVLRGEDVPAPAQSLSAPHSVMDYIRTATQSCQDPTDTSSWSQ